MDYDLTQPIPPENPQRKEDSMVFYRCSCGEELRLSVTVGGDCTECGKSVSPKALSHDLALTMTIDGDDVNELGITRTDFAASGSPDELIGKSFGHFEILAPLGRGGMGQVYRALDKSLQRYVAVKVLRSGIGTDTSTVLSTEDEIDMLLQEAVAQARVTHPNIVTIYYVGKQEGNPFLAMELVSGESLSERIADADQMPFSQIAPIAYQIVKALKFSHDLDIIHGDIKPSNVMLQPNGIAKLSDFGMARRASDRSSGKVGGTPNYIAPELLKGEKPSVQSDMYALGVTLFEMTFERLPVTLTGRTVLEWVDCHQGANVVFPSPWPERLPERWKFVLQKLLAKNPSDRFQSYEELQAELNNVQPESRVVARRGPRLIAALIDLMTVLLFMAPVQMLLSLSESQTSFNLHPVAKFLLQAADFIPILIYTGIVFMWRQSIGRGLMHVRVVNRYGMIPSQKSMALRSLLRMSVAWLACLQVFGIGSSQPLIVSILAIVIIVYLLLDLAFLFIYQKGRTVHDLVFDTHVVIDTD